MKNPLKVNLILVSMAAVGVPAFAQGQDYNVRRQIDTTVRLERNGTVDLSLISGKITVIGWDRSDVKVSASIESGMLRFDANSSRVTLSVDRSERDGRYGHHNVGDARYEVSVPRGAKLMLEAVSGDITASGSQGEIEATSVSGDVSVSNGAREVNVEAVSGSVRAVDVSGNLRAESVSGDVRAQDVSGNVEATSVSGSIRLLGIKSRDIRTETVSGDILYTGNIDPTGKYSYESHSGTIRLNIPSASGAQVSVETFSGDISTDFAARMPPNSRRGNGHFEFTIGDGKARITAQTFSGRIVINSDSGSTTRRDDE
ncbi:MAG: DUF4097 domain-containing protein [Gemmatimonadaceae bacterium]